PLTAAVDALSVSVVLQVAVQLAENEAVTPAGSEDVENVTGTALPEVMVAVITSLAWAPEATEVVEEAAESGKLDDVEAAVVKVKSPESERWPPESADATR